MHFRVVPSLNNTATILAAVIKPTTAARPTNLVIQRVRVTRVPADVTQLWIVRVFVLAHTVREKTTIIVQRVR